MCFGYLSTRRIDKYKEIDWEVLHEVGLTKEIQHLISARVWRQFFIITDTKFQELKLDVLETFKPKRSMVSYHKGKYYLVPGVRDPLADEPDGVLSQIGALR